MQTKVLVVSTIVSYVLFALFIVSIISIIDDIVPLRDFSGTIIKEPTPRILNLVQHIPTI